MKKNDEKRCRKILLHYKPTVGIITKDGIKMQIPRKDNNKND